MPVGNGTGPNGMGPGTGRGMGFCSGYDRAGYASAPGGRGRGFRGRGFGLGMGMGRGVFGARSWGASQGVPAYSREDRLNVMKSEADYMERNLQNIREEISRMEKGENE